MDDPDSLEGMARSIDALFSDAERRHARPGPGAAEEVGEAEADAAAGTERPRGAGRRDVEASVASADLLDDVEVIVPRARGARGAGGAVTIDAEDDEDPHRLAEAAARGLEPTGLDAPTAGPDADAEALDVEPTALDDGPTTLDVDLDALDAGFPTSPDEGPTLDADLSSLDEAAPTLDADTSSPDAAPAEPHAAEPTAEVDLSSPDVGAGAVGEGGASAEVGVGTADADAPLDVAVPDADGPADVGVDAADARAVPPAHATPDTGAADADFDAGAADAGFDTGVAPADFDAGEAPTDFDAGEAPADFDAGAAPADVAPARRHDVAEPVRRTPKAPDEVALRARATVTAVEEYLRAGPDGREPAADAVRAAAAAHREARELDAPADAVERLGLADDRDAVELARELAVSPVASRVVVRLGMAREDERREELFRVAEALGDALAPALADALSDAEDRSARRNFMEALVRLGDTGVREAEAMIGDPRWFVVRNGVAILGEAGGARAVENLTSTLGHEHPRVRRETLLALARIGGEDAGILASGKLEDPEAEVRAAAAMAVGALRVERAQRTLQALLEREEDEDVLVEVLRALGQLGDPGAVPAIEKKAVGTFFSRPPTEVRAAAYRALASIGTPHARRVIEGAAEDKEVEIRRLATSLLQER